MELAGAIKLSLTAIREARNLYSKFVEPPKKDDDTLAVHIIGTERWSSSVSIFGMSQPLDVDRHTLPLDITNQPRRFFSGPKRKEVKEEVILQSNASMIVLGDPGCGKTTLMKRLIRRYIVEAPATDEDQIEFPMLVMGRDITSGHSLMDDLFDKLGFSVRTEALASEKELKEWAYHRNAEVSRAVFKALSIAKVAIFIDGIDEMDVNVRANFQEDLQKLANSLTQGRVIATCRSGDWSHISSFALYEICPLSQPDIEAIVQLWAEEPAEFLRHVETIPYKDILNRPLFVTMLIVLFNQMGSLPNQPVEVYQRVTNLLLEKWDLHRGVRRKSQYDNFLTERKHRFLCAIAFVTLTYVKKRRFSSEELRNAYEEVHRAFGLPRNDGAYVVKEIESHTGLIVESGFDHFEFSHLTIHEFLCAQHLVGMSDFRQACRVIGISPASVAVATCLASDPGRYLGLVLWNFTDAEKTSDEFEENLQAIESTFARLELERPILVPNPMLGAAMLRILSLYDHLYRSAPTNKKTGDRLNRIVAILRDEAIIKSIDAARSLARVRHETTDVEIRIDTRLQEGASVSREHAIRLSRHFIGVLVGRNVTLRILQQTPN